MPSEYAQICFINYLYIRRLYNVSVSCKLRILKDGGFFFLRTKCGKEKKKTNTAIHILSFYIKNNRYWSLLHVHDRLSKITHFTYF